MSTGAGLRKVYTFSFQQGWPWEKLLRKEAGSELMSKIFSSTWQGSLPSGTGGLGQDSSQPSAAAFSAKPGEDSMGTRMPCPGGERTCLLAALPAQPTPNPRVTTGTGLQGGQRGAGPCSVAKTQVT